MLNDRQGFYGPFAYTIVAADIAVSADTTRRQAETETPTVARRQHFLEFGGQLENVG